MSYNQSKQCQSLLDNINDVYNQDDFEQMAIYCKQLHELAQQEHDEFMELNAKYYDSCICYETLDFDQCISISLSILPAFEQLHEDFFSFRIYIRLGIIESENANYSESLEYYIHAFQLTKRHPEYKYSHIILNNIGNLFVWLGEYEPAMPYLLQAYQYYIDEQADSESTLTVIIINIIECLSIMKQYEECEHWFQIPHHYSDNAMDILASLRFCNGMEQAFQHNEYDKALTYVPQIIEKGSSGDEYIYHFRSFLRALSICINIGEQAYCDKLMSIMDHLNKDAFITSFLFNYAILKISYYHKFGSTNSTLCADEIYNDYFTYSQQFIKQLKYTYTNNMLVKLALEKEEDDKKDVINQNEQLLKNIKIDHFTQIYNKISFQDYVEEKLMDHDTNCFHCLMMIDVDYFKLVNDQFGHEIGDVILLDVVGLLKSCIDEDIEIGRFGGDEFMLYLQTIDQRDKVKQLAANIVTKAQDIQVPSAPDYRISLSIGISIMQGEVTFDALFQQADKALYTCKQQGRNGYRFYQPM